MKRRIVGLFVANITVFLVVGISFIVYSKVISPGQYGLYAAALSIASVLVLVLDGGLKTSIIKMEEDLAKEQEACIALLMGLVSLVLILILVGLQRPLLAWRPAIKQDLTFVILFVGTSLFFYPFVALPTAQLERRLEYGHIAWIESISTLIERGAPALFLLWTKAGVYSFLWALLLSRIFRSFVLARFHWIHIWSISRSGIARNFHLFREGGWIQFGTISSVVRDNLHTLIVGPLFGTEWIGYYAWAIQVSQLSSQAFAQISARVSLPVLAQARSFEKRWPTCLYQVRLLTILTAPILCGVWLVLPSINDQFFNGKWRPALLLIPFLFLRMIPGLATTPLGPLIMVQRGGYSFARANISWTLTEVLGALVFVSFLGPMGLAWSNVIVVWFGLWILVDSLDIDVFGLSKEVAMQLFRRPSLIFSSFSVITLAFLMRIAPSYRENYRWLAVFAIIMILCSYLLEPEIRGLLVNEKI